VIGQEPSPALSQLEAKSKRVPSRGQLEALTVGNSPMDHWTSGTNGVAPTKGLPIL
jgi:hypothetical protein